MSDRLARDPPPPAELREWMKRFGGVSIDASPDEIAYGAVRALRAALARPGRDRDGAFALLAADGLLTYAAEDCASSADPHQGLRTLLGEVAGASRGEDG